MLVRSESLGGMGECRILSHVTLDPGVDDAGESEGHFQAVLERKNSEHYSCTPRPGFSFKMDTD